MLLTTESVEDFEQSLTVIDHYRARWTIEDWRKVLKSGCRIEDRQLETWERMEVLLSIYSVIAWKVRHRSCKGGWLPRPQFGSSPWLRDDVERTQNSADLGGGIRTALVRLMGKRQSFRAGSSGRLGHPTATVWLAGVICKRNSTGNVGLVWLNCIAGCRADAGFRRGCHHLNRRITRGVPAAARHRDCSPSCDVD